MRVLRTARTCLRQVLRNGISKRQPWILKLCIPRKRSGKSERCGMKTLMATLLLLSLVSTIHLKIVGFGDYFVSASYTHDDFTGPCALPILNPFDPAMLRGFKKLQPFKCAESDPLVYFNFDNVLQLNASVLDKRQIAAHDVSCICKDVIRVDNDDWVKFSNPYPCALPLKYKDDFLNIECFHDSKPIYSNFISNIHRTKHYGKLKDDVYNVLLFGIDTVSRSSSIRNLNKTVEFLRKLDAFDFRGHMKNGENTYPNLMALLTGLRTSGKDEVPVKDETTEFFDHVPFIWKDFSRNNYTTLHAEDLPLLNTFNLRKKGFKHKPVDHYMRPFWLGWHEISPMRDYKNGISLELLNVGMLKESLEKYLCAGNVPNYVAHMDYVERFFDTYKDERKFALSFMVEIAHNNQNILNLADDEIHNFFSRLRDKGHLENTIVVMFSDHGPKTGDTFFTARMEKSLPMLYVLIPPKLRKDHPSIVKHLSENTKKLTTHFDMYATLRDVVTGSYGSPTILKRNGVVRGYSLFGQMPNDRSCAVAFIPEHFCVCYKSKEISVENNPLVQHMAKAVVNKLNDLLSVEPKCAGLELTKILRADHISEAQRVAYSINVIRPKLQQDLRQKYTVVIETKPGGGHFYATCIIREGKRIEVLDDIDRVNRYNNQSHCIDRHNLRHLCFCLDQLQLHHPVY